jgi:putative flippase GtrA
VIGFQIREFIIKILRFGIVGVVGMIIDFGTTYVAKEIFKAQRYVASALGFIIAATCNYLLNRYWTFTSNNPDIATEYTQFIVVSVIGLGINTAILYVLHHNRKMNFYVAKLLATAVTLIWNFAANYLYTFAKA